MKKRVVIGILVINILFLMLSFIPATAIAANEVTVTDYEGVETTIELPVKRIVCLSASMNQILSALGVEDRIVGRDKGEVFPCNLRDVPVVAESSNTPQLEAILELEPDLIIANPMLSDDFRRQFEAFDIPVIVERASDQKRLNQVISNLARIVEEEEKGYELIDFISHYRELIKERLADLKENERTPVYWEWYKPYKTGSAGASVQPRIVLAGGKNICADAQGKYPQVSSEYVWQRDPEVIIKREGRNTSIAEMKDSWQKLVSRTGIKETSAVKNDRVHIITWDISSGIPGIIGSLYYAKWLHPDRFADIKPDKVYTKLLKKFYGLQNYPKSVYP